MSNQRYYTLKKSYLGLAGTLVLGLSAAATPPLYAMELDETIEDAIMHNPEFREQVKAYQSIQSELDGAKGSWYPRIDLSAGIGHEEVYTESGTDTRGDDALTRRESSVRLTQNLFEGFGTENEIKRQQHRLDAAAYQVYATANQVALDMTEAYLNLIKEEELLELAKENMLTHQKILDQIIQRREAGIGNQVEVDQATARLALAKSNLTAARNNHSDTLSRFHRILGRFPDNELIPPTFSTELPKNIEKAVNLALMNHPTVHSANADISEALAQYEASKSPFYPRVDLEIERTYDHNINGVEGDNEVFQAMLRLRYNLYNGGKDVAERNRTASEMNRAVEIRNNSRRQVIENLRYAWNAYQYVGDQLEYVQQHIKLTRNTLEGYRQQFSLGRRTLLDLLNTEDEYITALRTLVNSENDYKLAQYRILNGMGILLDELDIQLNMVQVSADSMASKDPLDPTETANP